MERAVQWLVAVTAVVVGLSHLLRPGDWAEAYRQLPRCDRPGAFANGALSVVPGALIVAGRGSWAWPGAVLTAFGWLLVAKAAVCFLAPDRALRSMEQGVRSPRGFIVGGLLLLAVAGWACYRLWLQSTAAESNAAPERASITASRGRLSNLPARRLNWTFDLSSSVGEGLPMATSAIRCLRCDREGPRNPPFCDDCERWLREAVELRNRGVVARNDHQPSRRHQPRLVDLERRHHPEDSTSHLRRAGLRPYARLGRCSRRGRLH